jgi:hypothetical protein
VDEWQRLWLPQPGILPRLLSDDVIWMAGCGAVVASSFSSQRMAWLRRCPHMSADGRSEAQTAGLSGRPKRRQAWAASSCTQGTPAGFPAGMSGMNEVMDGAVQHAPQAGRQIIGKCYWHPSHGQGMLAEERFGHI